ncbi:MAG TPA: right-handed parallel beta-helix repeat-containing protein [Acetobacteraceae bacterium]|nr:right-handed parallel beta-helix repeat-containing protein [Acetobacteraceae bacterium]
MFRSSALALLLLTGCTGLTGAATLEVGPGKQFSDPGKAIAAAGSGDTVRIYPGEYYSCAIVRRSDLTIEGVGPGVVLRDTTCARKAILVIDGNNVTVRNLTLERARVPDQNGAGIRAEGGNLTVENTRFLSNENGILTASNPRATIRIIGSTFDDNGKCTRCCAHGIYVNHIGHLIVENSHFTNTHSGHMIKSRAFDTTVINNVIEDGPQGNSSYLVQVPNGGNVLIANNRMEKGPHAENWSAAISIGDEGATQPTPAIIVKDNVLTNDTGHTTIFVRNVTATPAQLSGNVFKGGPVTPLVGDGSGG